MNIRWLLSKETHSSLVPTSQVYWNRMLTSNDAAQVSMGLLPVQQFVNGANIRFGRKRSLWGGGLAA